MISIYYTNHPSIIGRTVVASPCLVSTPKPNFTETQLDVQQVLDVTFDWDAGELEEY